MIVSQTYLTGDNIVVIIDILIIGSRSHFETAWIINSMIFTQQSAPRIILKLVFSSSYIQVLEIAHIVSVLLNLFYYSVGIQLNMYRLNIIHFRMDERSSSRRT